MKADISAILALGELSPDQLRAIVAELDEMSKLKYEDVNPEDLVDIRTVSVDPEEPFLPRMLRYLKQIKNPYFYLVDDVVVQADFISSRSLQKIFEEHLAASGNPGPEAIERNLITRLPSEEIDSHD